MSRPQPRVEPATPQPWVAPSASIAEITVKSVLLGAILSVILGAANAYLGLFAGMTVSASIPAAVLSMGILRLFRGSTILENNIVQTAASAGESLAAGVIFTIPALVLLGVWKEFDYWETTMIAGFGGLLGVLFTIPLRRALIVEHPLQFPEGVATAEVLKVGESGGSGVKFISIAGLIGALFKLGETGFRFWDGAVERATYFGRSIGYFGTNLSPALLAVGYIVGLNISILIFLGGAVNWLVAIPIIAAMQPLQGGVSAADAANAIWSAQTRYLGVGAMVVGGLWALIRLRKSLVSGIRSGMEAYRRMRSGGGEETLRTERDLPMQWVGVATAVSIIPLFLIFWYFTRSIGIAAFMAFIMIIAGFLFSAVAGYMAGLVGSSNNPISGVTIATLLTAALLLLLLMGHGNPAGPASAIFIGAVVCCAAAIAGDNMQDLKSGYILGATPVKQQIMQSVGVVVAAVVMAPVLSLLLKAYGIGSPTPAHPNPLTAPQATLMAAVAEGVFHGGLPWDMVTIGMGIAVAVILLDLWLERRGSAFRTPVLAVAVGIYLPLELEVPIFLGGMIAWAAGRAFERRNTQADESLQLRLAEARTTGDRHGLLFAAGLITGEALIGIGMAIPIVLAGRSDVLAFWGTHHFNFIGLVLLAAVMWGLFRVATAPFEGAQEP
ncbi:MAG: oligopeptide transporter, OPT family [Thermoanaerobaculia bacterium]